MKTTLNSTTASIEMGREEFLKLWCKMTEIVIKDYMWKVQQAIPLSETDITLAKMLEKLYESFSHE